jgi:hypothetical protein
MPRTKTPLEDMTWDQLAEVARKRGLPFSFPKAELLARLRDNSKATQRRRREPAPPQSAQEFAELFNEFTHRIATSKTAVIAFDDAEAPTEAVALITLK